MGIEKWTTLSWENILKVPNVYGKYEIRDSKQNVVSSGLGRIKEVLSEQLLKYESDQFFFKYNVQDGAADLDRLGYWIQSKDGEEKEIQDLADSLREYSSDKTIEDFKKLCKADFEKRKKTK